MKKQIRKTFHHGNLREALLKASIKLLDAEGPDGVTIRAVAREAGVSHAAPMNHFKDRKTLLTAVSVVLFTELGGRIKENLIAGKNSLLDRVSTVAETLVDYGLYRPNRYRMLWRRDLVENEDEDLQEAMDQIYDDLIAEISKTTKKRKFDDDTIAIALWSMAHGYVSMRLDGNFESKTDQISGQPREKAMLSAFLKALSD